MPKQKKSVAARKPPPNGNTGKAARKAPQTADYRHQEEAVARPDVGTQPQFRKKAPPKTYRYDSSLAPSLEWDGQNPAREQGEVLIARAQADLTRLREAASKVPEKGREPLNAAISQAEESIRALKTMSRPFLNWAGKAERLSFDVPTLPLFVHERLSTRAILETLKGHRSDHQLGLFDLFSDPQRPIHEQVLRAYEYKDDWVNRMILGDSLVVMNSLLHYESLGGQVQMIYMDPPYGVKFGSNFQPFVRKRDVAHNDDEDMTREPEMVQAYRDTWELGLHSYLTYLRDRLLLSRDLLTPSGSIFVQISDENLHHVRELMDEVFGADNFCCAITFAKTSGLGSALLQKTQDFLLWYAKDKSRIKFRQLFTSKLEAAEDDSHYQRDSDGNLYTLSDLSGQFANYESFLYDYEFEGRVFRVSKNRRWKTTKSGMDNLVKAGRVAAMGNSLRFKRYVSDFPASKVTDTWHDIGGSVQSRSDPKIYVVQSGTAPIQRCMLMTSDPGDIVIDPTCGSGTTAYVAEQWGRRWITIDTSRVPLALARQRLLTATFSWFELSDENRGPAGGFTYRRKQNSKGEEIGGIVSHLTLRAVANNDSPDEEVLVDRPEEVSGVTRVTGPFVVEATIPTAMGLDAATEKAQETAADAQDFIDRMIEILRHSPVIQIGGGKTVTLRNLRRPAKTLMLSAEAVVDATGGGKSARLDEVLQASDEANRLSLQFSGKTVALVFGPENGAIAERLVWEAAREAQAKNYTHLYVIGFAIQPPARQLIENCERAVGIAATYVQATPDLMMGDLLKNMRSSQILSVCGLPEVALRKAQAPGHETVKERKTAKWFEVELLGLDVFDPATMKVEHRRADDVPAWFLDTDYNALSFHVCQAFFPRTSAWDNLKRALKGEYEDSVWEHLAGGISVPFLAGEHNQIAVKVIDDRGNELMVVKDLKEAE